MSNSEPGGKSMLVVTTIFVVWAGAVIVAVDGNHPSLAAIVFAWPVRVLGVFCGIVTGIGLIATFLGYPKKHQSCGHP